MTQPAGAVAPAAPEEDPAKKRKLKNFLLNREYQLRFTVVIVGISAALTSGLGWLVYHFLRVASRVVYYRAMDPTDTEANELQKQLAQNDTILLAALIGFGLLLSIVLTVYGIVVTHKVAGPLFKITLYMNKIRDGRLGKIYDLRKGDQLVEFFESFKEMHAALTRRTEEEIRVIEQAANEAEGAGAKKAAEALRTLKKEKETSLD
jgi:nitrogen fixation/metabolism regulation signal transduction histidine kinase